MKPVKQLEEELAQARAERKAADQKMRAAFNAWEKAVEAELAQFTFDITLFTPDFYRSHLSNFTSVTAQHEMIKKFYKAFDKRLVYGGGYHSEKLYPIPQIRMAKDDSDVDDIVAGLERINLMLEQDELYIDIFERTLSEYGSYYMNWYPQQDKCEIICMTYSQPKTLFEGTLRECLVECGAKYYYE